MLLSKYEIDYETLSPEHEFYQTSFVLLKGAIKETIARIDRIRNNREQEDKDPVEHMKARIKSVESMKDKLAKKNIQINAENAIKEIYDAAGVRIICTFINEIYLIVDMLKNQKDIEVINEEDYIRNPKKNGYRSYHMVLKVPVTIEDQTQKVFCEVQIRTIAMDCWASLEHQLIYKKNKLNEEMMVVELKRCADEIASTDLNLQTIWDMIEEIHDKDGDNNENITSRR